MDYKEKLINLQKEYINLLSSEINELASISLNRGWKSKRVEDGILIRSKIKECEDLIENEFRKIESI